MTRAPLIKTERLTLRHHEMADMEPFWAFYQSERAGYVSAPKNKTHMYYGFLSEIAAWDLLGYGGWAIDLDGQMIGQLSIIQPPHFPEREIGWILFDGFESTGYAYEAARAALDWAWGQGMETLVSYIDQNNPRSMALAERLGATLDPNAAKYDEVDVVYRHMPGGAA